MATERNYCVHCMWHGSMPVAQCPICGRQFTEAMPMHQCPPTLDQIRAVVREELARAQRDDFADSSTVASSVVVKEYHNCAPEIDGPSVTAELEHQGKVYKGILYFVKDLQ